MLNGLIDWITRVIGDHGFPAILALMTLESACIPIPSEVIQLFAGYLVSIDRMTLFAAVSAGVLGNVLGSWIAWSVGYFGGRPFIERWGRYLHVTPARMPRAERLVRRARRDHRARRPLRPGRSARSSRCPRASRACRSGASRCSRCSAASRGCSASP